MEIMDFCQKVKRGLCTYIGESVTIHVKKIVKNNGIILHSIIIVEKERNISPNIYLDELYEAYERGETFRSIMEEVLQTYEESRMKENIDMSFFLNYESMKEKVVYKLVNYEKNKKLLSQIPHIPFLDLAIIFYCHVPKRELGSATILIYNNHLHMWNISKERLYEDAKRNTERIMPPRLSTIEDMMREIFAQAGIDVSEEEKPAQQITHVSGETLEGKMLVLGNCMKLFGAASILYEGLLEKIANQLGRSFFILPSSVHEVIIVPHEEGQDGEELWNMVCEINATQVEPEDVLADSIYYFSVKNKKIRKLF